MTSTESSFHTCWNYSFLMDIYLPILVVASIPLFLGHHLRSSLDQSQSEIHGPKRAVKRYTRAGEYVKNP